MTEDVTLPRKRVRGDTVEERLTDNAVEHILPARYLLRDESGEVVETPAELFERVADAVSSPEDDQELWRDRFYELMTGLEFVPNSPTLMNAGGPLGQLSACFVMSPKDDLDDIFETVRRAARVFQSGGGVGYAFSELRPRGDVVAETGGVASGPVSFMCVYDQMCETVKAGGCIAAGSRVLTPDGYIPIEELHDGQPLREADGDQLVLASDGEFHRARRLSESGTMPMQTVETELGYEITVSDDHPLRVVRDGRLKFVEAADLTSGDTVVLHQDTVLPDVDVSLKVPDPDQYHHNTQTAQNLPAELNSDVARFLGVLWADGTFDGSLNRLAVTLEKDGNADPAAKEWLEDLLKRWGLRVRVVDEDPRGKGRCWKVMAQSQHLGDWLRENGLMKDAVDTIPEPIYRNPSVIPAFLGGLTPDAHVSSSTGTVVYSTACKDLAKTIQELLLLCGICSNRYAIEAGERKYSDRPTYSIQVNPGPSARQYDDRIPHFFDDLDGKSGGQRQNQIQFAPSLLSRLLSDYFEKNAKLPDDVDRAAMKELRRYERGDRTPSRERLVEQLNEVGIEPPEILSDNYLFDQIATCESRTTERAYDIEVLEGEPEFVTRNFVVHNKRRGAQMGVLGVDHPDIGRFCVAKREEGELENFNVSVAVTDDFLNALDAGEAYELTNPRTGEVHEVTEATAQFYNASHADADPRAVPQNFWRDYGDSVAGVDEFRGDLVDVGEPMTLPAEFVWRLIVDGAWRNGEPGVFAVDRANREHSFDVDEHPGHRIEATNPCGEQPLEDFEACNLGHVNLSLMAAEDAPLWNEFEHDGDLEARVDAFLDEALDTERLDRVTRWGTRFLDDVVTESEFPLPEIEETVSEMRKVGLGVMGFAELLVQLGVRYGSDESVEIADQVMARIDHVATKTSHELAAERGRFPRWDKSKYANPMEYPEWFRRHTGEDPEEWADGYPIRNHGVTSVAPTGTTSMIANTSGGCEPIYEVVYFKNVGRDVQGAEPLVEFDDYFLRVLEANDIDVDAVEEEAKRLLQEGEFEGAQSLSVPDEILELFPTARELPMDAHVRVQAAFQAHVDGAVSKTINVAHDATRGDVADAYRRAIDLGCVGVTVYRAGSRTAQVLTTKPEETGSVD